MTTRELQVAIYKTWKPCCHYGEYISLPAGTLVLINQCCEIDWTPSEAAAHAALAEVLKIDPSAIEVDEEVYAADTYTLRVFLVGVHIERDE